ncbi:zinc finger domain-containing protein [Streptomyces katrae]|uniref:zinc finger domain-containing protein n=1 Tax=Streptomyces katrae TaxID=68223 RepID=UPI003B5B17F6
MAVERHECPNCDAPAGSACRTRGGKTAAKYHTPRFVLVPALRGELEVLVPTDRHPVPACGSRARRSPSCPRPAPSARSASGTPGRRRPGRSWRASSKHSTVRSATRSFRSRSVPA